jgi:hypothetical protein
VLRDIPVPAPRVAEMVMELGDDDEEQEQVDFHYEKIAWGTGTYLFAPTIAEAEAAFEDIKKILKPSRKNGLGSIHHGS